MPRKAAKRRLVIDTDIARSASESASQDQRAALCREFLEVIRDLSFRVVLTPQIFAEWEKHWSRFTVKWLSNMTARKLTVYLRDVENPELWSRIEAVAPDYKVREAMFKDFHLIEAALASDQTISSLDETARDNFKQIVPLLIDIRDIIWLNPEKSEEGCTAWLKNGAEYEAYRCLGHQEPES